MMLGGENVFRTLARTSGFCFSVTSRERVVQGGESGAIERP